MIVEETPEPPRINVEEILKEITHNTSAIELEETRRLITTPGARFFHWYGYNLGNDLIPGKLIFALIENKNISQSTLLKTISIPASFIQNDFRRSLEMSENFSVVAKFFDSPFSDIRAHVMKNPNIAMSFKYERIVAYPSDSLSTLASCSIGFTSVNNAFLDFQRKDSINLSRQLDEKVVDSSRTHFGRGVLPGNHFQEYRDEYQKFFKRAEKIVKSVGKIDKTKNIHDYARRCYLAQPIPPEGRLKIPETVFRAILIKRRTKKYVNKYYAAHYEYKKHPNQQNSTTRENNSTNDDVNKVAPTRSLLVSHKIKPLHIYKNSIRLQKEWTKDYEALPDDRKNEVLLKKADSKSEGLYAIVDTFKSTNTKGQEVRSGLNNFVHHINNLKELQIRTGVIAVRSPTFVTPVGFIKVESQDGSKTFGERIVFSINSTKFEMRKPPHSDEWKQFSRVEGASLELLEPYLSDDSSTRKTKNNKTKKRRFWLF